MPKQAKNPSSKKRFFERENILEAKTRATPARLYALSALIEIRKRRTYAQELIEGRINKAPLSSSDRAFATLLINGVSAMRGTLDDLINRALRSPHDISPGVRDALCISSYELFFLDKEAYAVVDQGVELVRAISPKAAAVANACLRKLLQLKPHFPFGDPQEDIEAFVRLEGFPLWLAQRIVDEMGTNKARPFMQISNEPAPLFIAINSAVYHSEDLRVICKEVGAELEAVQIAEREVSGCYKLKPSNILSEPGIAQLLAKGKILVSDASAQFLVNAFLPQSKPQSVLEVGAGRGTKTLLLEACAHRRWGSGFSLHLALDKYEDKLRLLKQRCKQYGHSHIECLTADETSLKQKLSGQSFDFVFIDAPCSGLGTLRRHPELRWRLNPSVIDELSHTQLSLLKAAAAQVARKGILVYSTCTVLNQENIQVVDRFLASSEGSNFELFPFEGKEFLAPHLTSGGPDAHFGVRFRRKD